MSEKRRILVVEDERDVRELILLHLAREGCEATAVENGENALRALENAGYDLLILDWMLPGVSGLDLCKRVRAQPEHRVNPPILMVTARADSADIVLGLEMGADDYITKPFEIPVLLARVRALLRRAQATQPVNEAKRIRNGELAIDLEKHEVTCGGEKVSLTPSEFRLLTALMSNPGRVLSRERLIDLVQGQDVSVTDRTIDTHVFGLRRKLGPCSEVIETIRGVGYRVRA